MAFPEFFTVLVGHGRKACRLLALYFVFRSRFGCVLVVFVGLARLCGLFRWFGCRLLRGAFGPLGRLLLLAGALCCWCVLFGVGCRWGSGLLVWSSLFLLVGLTGAFGL